jgi:tetratricopeptide (TPR) repeat protein
VETTRFFFWEILKVVSLTFLGLVCAKAVAGLSRPAMKGSHASPSQPDALDSVSTQPPASTPAWTGFALYGVVFLLVALGAQGIGNELAAEFYFRASGDSLNRSQPVKAYSHALRAVELRPAQVKYWQMLSTTKLALRQYQSLLEDRPALESLDRGPVGEQDAMRFAFAHFFLGQYDQTIAIARELIKQNRPYAAPYVLLGMTYIAGKRYSDAERTFLDVLQMYPSQEGAVEGLAHLYFLRGNPARALAVLDQTPRFPFDPDARKRFEELKALYREAQGQDRLSAPSGRNDRVSRNTGADRMRLA